jgi:hypothetical protein
MKNYHLDFSLEPITYQNESGLDCIEQWKDIPEYEGLYQVSDLGRVKRLDRHKNHSSGKGTFLSKEKIMKQSKGQFYYSVGLYIDLNLKTWLVHHLVSIVFLNHYPKSNNLVIDHKDNIKENNMLSNLQLISVRENSSKDSVSKSGILGVRKVLNRFESSIQHNGKIFNLGSFESAKDASEKHKQVLNLINLKQDFSNLVKIRNNKNSFTGVCKSKNKFQARIIIEDKFINLGMFDTAEQAGNTYLKALNDKNNGIKVNPINNIKLGETNYKGVHKSGMNFRVRLSINGINKDLGTFPNVELANNRYLEAKKLISEGKSVEHFYSQKAPNKTYKGVFRNGDKYQAKLTVKGKTNNLGTYDNPESARDVYNEAIFLLKDGKSIEHLIKRKILKSKSHQY